MLIRNTWCIVATQSGHFEIILSNALLFPQAELGGRIPVRATVDIDTLLPMLFAAGFSLAPPFRQLFTKKVEPNGFLSSGWLNVVVNLRLI